MRRGWGGGPGNVCFSVSNLVQPEELHTPLRLKHTIHDGLTYMITHECPPHTYARTRTHVCYHDDHASLKVHQLHQENLSPSSSFIVLWFVIANAVPNYTLVRVITLPSSASLNDFSPLSPALKGLFDVSRSIFGCCIDRVKLRVPPIRAQRAHCFIFKSTVPSERDYSSGGLFWLDSNIPGWTLHVLKKNFIIYKYKQTAYLASPLIFWRVFNPPITWPTAQISTSHFRIDTSEVVTGSSATFRLLPTLHLLMAQCD